MEMTFAFPCCFVRMSTKHVHIINRHVHMDLCVAHISTIVNPYFLASRSKFSVLASSM